MLYAELVLYAHTVRQKNISKYKYNIFYHNIIMLLWYKKHSRSILQVLYYVISSINKLRYILKKLTFPKYQNMTKIS